MRRLDTSQAANWFAAQAWVAPAFDRHGLRVTAGDGLTRYRVEIDEDSASVGCAMASGFLHDVDPPSFDGGILWVTGTFPHTLDNLRFARQLILGFGVDIGEQGSPWFLRFDPGEFAACWSTLALSLMFGWDACLVLAGRRLLVEADNDQFPSLVTDRVSGWLAEAMANWDATVTPWPFRTRFVGA